jgi:signal peptidase I
MAILNNWSWNGKGVQGIVKNHPEFRDGDVVITSRIVGVIGDSVTTKSGTTYELGSVDESYEAEYPNAKERLLKAIKERSK